MVSLITPYMMAMANPIIKSFLNVSFSIFRKAKLTIGGIMAQAMPLSLKAADR